MAVLIVSSPGDAHALAVMEAISQERNERAELLNLADFPSQISVSASFFKGAREAHFLRTGTNILDLRKVTSVWWRRPQSLRIPDSVGDPMHRRFAASEGATALQGVFQTMRAFWVNDPERDVKASHKPWQLAAAQDVGLEIPPTLMTSDPHAARAFYSEHGGNVIYKQFLALPDAWRETRLLRQEEVDNLDQVRLAPVIFQAYIDAVADIRVIAIGQKIFAAAAELSDIAYPVDIRLNLNARYRLHNLPSEVEQLLLALMRHLGLEYGAIDLRLTPDDRYVFLEINPAGQFLYIEYATGQPISLTLARLLTHKIDY